MAYKKVRNPFAIYYNDGSYMVYDLNEDDYKAVTLALLNGQAAVSLTDIGIFKLDDVRSVIKQKPEPKAPTSAVPEMSSEEMEYYAQQKALWDEYGKEDGGIEQ